MYIIILNKVIAPRAHTSPKIVVQSWRNIYEATFSVMTLNLIFEKVIWSNVSKTPPNCSLFIRHSFDMLFGSEIYTITIDNWNPL